MIKHDLGMKNLKLITVALNRFERFTLSQVSGFAGGS
jgi:hypothetical protein